MFGFLAAENKMEEENGRRNKINPGRSGAEERRQGKINGEKKGKKIKIEFTAAQILDLNVGKNNRGREFL